MPATTCIKAKLENIVRCQNPNDVNGFKNKINVALDKDVVTYPAAPAFTADISGSEFITAVVADAAKPFGVDPIWSTWEVKAESIKVNGKPVSNFRDSKAMNYSLEFEMFMDKPTVGQLSKLRGADLQLVLEQPNELMQWFGRKGEPCYIDSYEVENDKDKSLVKVKVMFHKYDPLFLPAGGALIPIA